MANGIEKLIILTQTVFIYWSKVFLLAYIVCLSTVALFSQQIEFDGYATPADALKESSFKCSVGIVGAHLSSLGKWGYGTGFITVDSFTVITANHLVREADSILFILCGKQIPLSIQDQLADIDIAILHSIKPISAPMPYNNTDIPLKGSVAVTIGYDAGIRVEYAEIMYCYQENRDRNSTKYIRFRGTGQSGYSGGPLLNSEGEVIGITLRGQKKIAGLSEATAVIPDFLLNH